MVPDPASPLSMHETAKAPHPLGSGAPGGLLSVPRRADGERQDDLRFLLLLHGIAVNMAGLRELNGTSAARRRHGCEPEATCSFGTRRP
jgi:hypothetical protein